ncbi:MAG: AMP-binding protein, partial [Mycobacteriales bacterium]
MSRDATMSNRLTESLDAVRILRAAGVLTPIRPDKALGMALSLRYGVSLAAGYTASAARHGRRTAIVDDAGSLTYAEVAARTDALAASYAPRGIGAGTAVGVLARNGRGFIEPAVALAKIGADVVLLNTGMAAPQLAEVAVRERLVAAVADDDLADLLPPGLVRLPAAVPPGRRVRQPTPPREPGRIVLLTSGT